MGIANMKHLIKYLSLVIFLLINVNCFANESTEMRKAEGQLFSVLMFFVFCIVVCYFKDFKKIASNLEKKGLIGESQIGGGSRKNHDNIIGSETNRWPHLRASNMYRRR